MAYLPRELSMEDRRLFWRNYDKWCALFTPELVDEQLAKLSVMSIVDEQLYPLRDAYGRPKQAPEKVYGVSRHLGRRSTYYRFVNESGWEKSEFVPCEVFMVPARYQSTKHGDMIEPMMHALYPWLAKFKCDFYSLNFYDNRAEEFYVRVGADVEGHRSLYVPYEAFKAGHVAAIVERNEKYLRWYNKDKDVWGTMKKLPTVNAFLDKVREMHHA